MAENMDMSLVFLRMDEFFEIFIMPLRRSYILFTKSVHFVVSPIMNKVRSDEGYILHGDLENQLLNAVEFNYVGKIVRQCGCIC